MSAAAFEFNLLLPHEPRYLAMLRDVVVSAARQAGCTDPAAAAFGESVADAALAATPGADDTLAVVVRQADGLMEVQLGNGPGARALSVRA